MINLNKPRSPVSGGLSLRNGDYTFLERQRRKPERLGQPVVQPATQLARQFGDRERHFRVDHSPRVLHLQVGLNVDQQISKGVPADVGCIEI